MPRAPYRVIQGSCDARCYYKIHPCKSLAHCSFLVQSYPETSQEDTEQGRTREPREHPTGKSDRKRNHSLPHCNLIHLSASPCSSLLVSLPLSPSLFLLHSSSSSLPSPSISASFLSLPSRTLYTLVRRYFNPSTRHLSPFPAPGPFCFLGSSVSLSRFLVLLLPICPVTPSHAVLCPLTSSLFLCPLYLCSTHSLPPQLSTVIRPARSTITTACYI